MDLSVVGLETKGKFLTMGGRRVLKSFHCKSCGWKSFKSDLGQLMLGISSLYNRGRCDDPLDPLTSVFCFLVLNSCTTSVRGRL